MMPGVTGAGTAGAADLDGFSNIDRRMGLSFGWLILGLMLTVLLCGGWYLRDVMEREHNRLATVSTQVLADAVGRVSFAGKHQARLLLEEIQQKNPDLAYVRLIDAHGHVVAHSQSQENDKQIDEDELTYVLPLFQLTLPLRVRTVELPEGAVVREVSTVYLGGFGNEVQGVLQVGITDTARALALRSGMVFMGALLLLLMLVGGVVTSRLSRHFGLPVRKMALDMAVERQRLENVLHAMHAGTWEWNVQTHSVMLDARWAEIIGYELQDLLPITEQTFVNLCHPEDLKNSRKQIDAYFAGEIDIYACESRMRHKQGHWVWVFDCGRIVERDALGMPLRMMGARQDITARKLAEESFRQESERFLALAQVSNTGVWEWDHGRQYLWCSPEYFSMLGLDYSSYHGDEHLNLERVWLNFLHPDDRERARQCFADYLSAGALGIYENEFRMLHSNGEWIWIWSRGSALHDNNGRPTGKTMGTHINISAIKQTESRLRESQERLQLISDNIPGGMVFQIDCGVAGETRVMNYLSEGVRHLHGFSVEEVMADVSLLYGQISSDDSLRLQNHEQDCIDEMTNFKTEVCYKNQSGSTRWSMISSSPRRMENGHVIFDGIEIDITDRKRRDQEIHELNTNLEQRVRARTADLSDALDHLRRTQQDLLQSEKLASLGALVAGVAHELNTPIGNAVTVASTLVQTHQRFKALTEKGLTRSALADYLGDVQEGGSIIERNLVRAAELIGSFKQLAVDQTSTQRRHFDVHDVVQEISMAMRPTIRKTNVQIEEDVVHGLVLDSYPGPLGQVLMNLINNALIHAFEGRATGSIHLSAQAGAPGWLCMSVADDGCGIPVEHQSKIFDPFFTTKLGQGGSGLGLHITYTLVTGLLGGRIEIDSQPDKGSRFVLHLPLVAPVPPTGTVEGGLA